MAADGRLDRRVATTEPAGHLALRRERLLGALLRERLAVLRLLARRLARVLALRVLTLLRAGRLLVRLAVLLLTGLLAGLLAGVLTRLRTGLARLLLVRLGVLGELLLGRTVAGRLT
ncbi:hypothetical protein OHA18_35575 [Kribbella sp. NBC_00709]|uniref:hypothetical protein n=1 Tax=Kribbella sp. NBC_00709 TaxID=2975972 RepID=UPI002E2AA555|nr:hypothetical protein [Kribbella sp. NBC_00709]